MEIFSALLALYDCKPMVIGGFPSQRPLTRSFGIFFDLHLNKRLSKQWWFETPSRRYDVTVISHGSIILSPRVFNKKGHEGLLQIITVNLLCERTRWSGIVWRWRANQKQDFHRMTPSCWPRKRKHDDAMTWKRVPHYWPFVTGINWSPLDFPCKGPVMRVFSLLSVWTSCWWRHETPWNSCDTF